MSTDGGRSWSAHPNGGTSNAGGSVAYSADGSSIIWSTSANGVLYSQSLAAFQQVSSLPSGAVIAADRRNGTVFYAASGSSFYTSSDSGVTFQKGAGTTGVTAIRDIAAHPTSAGEVWVGTDAGVFRSTNYGTVFTKVGNDLSNAFQLAFGLGSGPGNQTWVAYAFGNGAAGPKLYANKGASWADIQGDQGFGEMSSCKLAGSGNVKGQVYVGTNGRGVFRN